MGNNTLTDFNCIHPQKKFKLKIDGGINEIFHLILCASCYANQKPRFVIKEEVL